LGKLLFPALPLPWPLTFACVLLPQIRCGPGRFSAAGAAQCTPCPSGSVAADSGAAACTPCPTAYPFSVLGNAQPSACVCPPGHACSLNNTPTPCPANTYSHVGDSLCTPCPPLSISPPGSDDCLLPCPAKLQNAGVYVSRGLRSWIVCCVDCTPLFKLALSRLEVQTQACVSLACVQELCMGIQPAPECDGVLALRRPHRHRGWTSSEAVRTVCMCV
jgi:hypothetical protein